nr:hypothetical protein GCM10020093_072500 [Planobispora longispora]
MQVRVRGEAATATSRARAAGAMRFFGDRPLPSKTVTPSAAFSRVRTARTAAAPPSKEAGRPSLRATCRASASDRSLSLSVSARSTRA